MSHYTVAVFTERGGSSVEELLAPFDENIRVPRYLDQTKAQVIAEGRARVEKRKRQYEQFLNKKAEEQERDPNCHFFRNEFPEWVDCTDEKIYQHEILWYNKDMIDPETGDVYSTYNPNSKWDWYSVGGRWGGSLIKKDGSSTNEALVRDLEFEKMRQAELDDLEPYEDYLSKHVLYSREYLESIYPDEKTYIEKMTEFTTFAALTPDGEWHEKGSMGWFGMSSETPDEDTAWHKSYYDAFIKPALENNWTITLVDCHI